MTLVVLDASVAIAWIASSQSNGKTREILRSARKYDFICPFIFPFEIRNGLLNLENRRIQNAAETDIGLMKLAELSLETMPELADSALDEIFGLARDRRVSLFDALYIDLAVRVGCALASRDGRQIEAATKIGVLAMDLRGSPA